MCYAQAYHQQVKEAFPDPNSKDTLYYSLEPGDGILEVSSEEESSQAPLEGTLPSTLDY